MNLKELSQFISNKSSIIPTHSSYEQIKYLLTYDIFENLGWKIPFIIDINELLSLPQNYGQVLALSFVNSEGKGNLKNPFFVGLLVNQLLQRKINNNSIDTIVDAGGMNTCFAIYELSKLLSCNGLVITSRYYPDHFFKSFKQSNCKIVRANSNNNLSIEEEFYSEFVNKMRSNSFRKNKIPLWHVKYSLLIAKILDLCGEYKYEIQ